MSEHDPRPVADSQPEPEGEIKSRLHATKPTTFKAFSRSQYVTATDLGTSRPTKTIKAIDGADFENDKGELEPKMLVTFADAKKQMVGNRTNQALLYATFLPESHGSDVVITMKELDDANPQDSVGRRITIAASQDRVGNRMEPCVRIVGSPEMPVAKRSVNVKLPMKGGKTRSSRWELTRTVTRT